MKLKLKKIFFAGSLVFSTLFITNYKVNAESWRANSPSQIQVSENQKEYTMKYGDTLWAIGQKTNIKYERLAEINGINLDLGDQYHLPVGRVISIEGNVATVTDPDGKVYSQSIIQDRDRISSPEATNSEESKKTEIYPQKETNTSESENKDNSNWKIPDEMREQLISVGFEANFIDGLTQDQYETAVERSNQKIKETGYGDVGALFYELDEMFPGSWKNKPSYSTKKDTNETNQDTSETESK